MGFVVSHPFRDKAAERMGNPARKDHKELETIKDCSYRYPTLGAKCAPKVGHPVFVDGKEWKSGAFDWAALR